jgi:hypothetical protein
MYPHQEKLIDNLKSIPTGGDTNINRSIENTIDKIESNEEISKKKKKEYREATGAASAGPFAAPLFGEPTSKKTSNPISGKVPEVRETKFRAPKMSMFSDEANGYKIKEEKLKGGKADNKTFQDLVNKNKKKGTQLSELERQLKTQLNKGIKVEMEHTKDRVKAKEITMDHLFEDPKYYDKLSKIESKESRSAKEKFKQDLKDDPEFQEYKKGAIRKDPFTGDMYSFGVPNVTLNDPFIKKKKYSRVSKSETKEATGAGSSGSYSQPSIWAKSTNKKDWAAARKTQIPGGQFVTVKKKCKKFPYCNQGDIKALKLWENETMKQVIDNVSQKTGLSETTIKAIIQHELEKNGKLH